MQTLNSSIASFADGSYVVSYTLDNGGGNTDILARIVSPTGTVGAPITVRDNGTLDADLSQLATLSNGNFVDVYQQTVGFDHDIYFSIYTRQVRWFSTIACDWCSQHRRGNRPRCCRPRRGRLRSGMDRCRRRCEWPRHSSFNLQQRGGPGRRQHPAQYDHTRKPKRGLLVGLADGGFAATWEDDAADLVRGQRFDALGNKIGVEYTVKVGNSVDSPDSALLADGRIGYAVGDFSSGDADVNTTIFDPNTPPTITSNGAGATAAISIAENTTAVTTVTATDPDIGQTLSYSIIGGADAGKFTIDPSTGALSFITAPNFETPTDTGGNNVYDVIVQVSDGFGGIDTQAIAVTVTDVLENTAPATITVAATDGSGTEAADGSPDFTFTFTRTGDTSQALSVNYNVFSSFPNGAFTGLDINTASSGIVLFAAGSATATLTFNAIDDLQAENTESFTVSISPDNPMNP